MTKQNQKSGQSTQMRQKNPNFPGSGKEETPGTVWESFKKRTCAIGAQKANGKKIQFWSDEIYA